MDQETKQLKALLEKFNSGQVENKKEAMIQLQFLNEQYEGKLKRFTQCVIQNSHSISNSPVPIEQQSCIAHDNKNTQSQVTLNHDYADIIQELGQMQPSKKSINADFNQQNKNKNKNKNNKELNFQYKSKPVNETRPTQETVNDIDNVANKYNNSFDHQQSSINKIKAQYEEKYQKQIAMLQRQHDFQIDCLKNELQSEFEVKFLQLEQNIIESEQKIKNYAKMKAKLQTLEKSQEDQINVVRIEKETEMARLLSKIRTLENQIQVISTIKKSKEVLQNQRNQGNVLQVSNSHVIELVNNLEQQLKTQIQENKKLEHLLEQQAERHIEHKNDLNAMQQEIDDLNLKFELIEKENKQITLLKNKYKQKCTLNKNELKSDKTRKIIQLPSKKENTFLIHKKEKYH